MVGTEAMVAFVGGENEHALLGKACQVLEAAQSGSGKKQVGIGEGVLIVCQEGLQGGIEIGAIGEGLIVVVNVQSGQQVS